VGSSTAVLGTAVDGARRPVLGFAGRGPATGLLIACVGLLAVLMTFEALDRCRSARIPLARWQKTGLAFSAGAVATLIVVTSAATVSALYLSVDFPPRPPLWRSPFKMAAVGFGFLTAIVMSLYMKTTFWSEEYVLSLAKRR